MDMPHPLQPSHHCALTCLAASPACSSIFIFFFPFFGGFATVVYPLNSFQMGLRFSSFLQAGGARRLPTGRCRAEHSICRGFGSAGCGGSSRARLAGQRSAGTWRRSQTPSGLGRPEEPFPHRQPGRTDGWTDGRMAPAPLGTRRCREKGRRAE